jgi:hypothetical protein
MKIKIRNRIKSRSKSKIKILRLILLFCKFGLGIVSSLMVTRQSSIDGSRAQ